jgi:hypothetical protein
MAVPNWPILSGSSCSCTAACGTKPKWIRVIMSWTSGISQPSLAVDGVFVGKKFVTRICQAGGFPADCDTSPAGKAQPSWTKMPYLVTGTTWACMDPVAFYRHTITSYTTPTTYTRYTGTTTTATFDINFDKYKTDKPTKTTMVATLNPNVWYQNLTSDVFNLVNTSCSDFEFGLSFWSSGWTMITHANSLGYVSFNRDNLGSSSTNVTFSVKADIYDRDPNTTGAVKMSSIASYSPYTPVKTPTSFSAIPLTLTITYGSTMSFAFT